MAKMLKSIITLRLLLFLVNWCAGQLAPEDKARCHLTSGSIHHIQCDKITEPEHVIYLQQSLDSLQQQLDHPIKISFENSDIDVLSPEVFSSYNVTNLLFQNCFMTKIPYHVICFETVRVAEVIHTQIQRSTLRNQGFRDCNKLQHLVLLNTSLQEIIPGSFQGLENLVELRLEHNQIDNVPELSGLETSLERLTIASNSIMFIAKNAFKNMGKLKYLILQNCNITTIQNGTFEALGPGAQVDLSGNPLHCNCSLQWLQKWFKRNPLKPTETRGMPYCATPTFGPLMTTDFCNTKTPLKSSGTSFCSGRILVTLSVTVMILLSCHKQR